MEEAQKHEETCLEFPLEHQNMIWIDESTIETGKNSQQVYLWRHIGEEYDGDHLTLLLKAAGHQ